MPIVRPPMMRVEQIRGGVVESSHTVHAAVVDREGRLVARAGDPDLVTFWRSAAKPFQALPLVVDGAAAPGADRKSTHLLSTYTVIPYAVVFAKKKNRLFVSCYLEDLCTFYRKCQCIE